MFYTSWLKYRSPFPPYSLLRIGLLRKDSEANTRLIELEGIEFSSWLIRMEVMTRYQRLMRLVMEIWFPVLNFTGKIWSKRYFIARIRQWSVLTKQGARSHIWRIWRRSLEALGHELIRDWYTQILSPSFAQRSSNTLESCCKIVVPTRNVPSPDQDRLQL